MINSEKWIENYIKKYDKLLYQKSVVKKMVDTKELWKNTQKKGGKIIFVGNGGSAAMASHCSVDLTKNAKVRSINFNEADLITCFANDYGYKRWVEKAIEFYSNKNDSVVLISSSGKSENIINGAKKAIEMEIPIITLTGFNQNNPLGQLGLINYWVNSKAYNIIEMTHHIWLLTVVDLIIGKSEYPAN